MSSLIKALCLSLSLPFMTEFLCDIQPLTSCSTLCTTSTQIPLFWVLRNRRQRILDIRCSPTRYANYSHDFTHPAQYSAIAVHTDSIHAWAPLSVGMFTLMPVPEHARPCQVHNTCWHFWNHGLWVGVLLWPHVDASVIFWCVCHDQPGSPLTSAWMSLEPFSLPLFTCTIATNTQLQ